jgi:hypothetical protein
LLKATNTPLFLLDFLGLLLRIVVGVNESILTLWLGSMRAS